MATVDHDVQGDWTLIGQGAGQYVVTAFGKNGRLVSTNTTNPPSFNPNLVGAILPDRQNVTVLLTAGEYLWLNGTGHFTVIEGF